MFSGGIPTEKFTLKWNDFQNNVSKTLSDFRRDEEFFDVTLVSEDLQHISAHKLVLSACSELFKLILRKSSHPYPHPNPLIYLNGFRAKELNFIMEYIYHGEVRILQDDIHNFLEVARKLKIEGLIEKMPQSEERETELNSQKSIETIEMKPDSESIDTQNESISSIVEDQSSETPISKEKMSKPKKEKSLKTIAVFNQSILSKDDIKAIVDNHIEKYENNDGEEVWKCRTCGKSSSNKVNLAKHVEIHIEGLSFECQVCGKSYKTRMSLDQHKKLKHTRAHHNRWEVYPKEENVEQEVVKMESV